MEINKSLRSGIEDIDEYIIALEDFILTQSTSNIHKLIKSADELAGVIAEDMMMVINGDKDNLKLLSSDSQDKITERMVLILKSISIFKEVSDTAKELTPKVKATAEEEAATKKEADINVPLIERMPRRSKLK